ncbi:MAG: SGNH/GDSL hydrolase family protein [Bacteroidia bacterium]|nr:SGNH/GDSL hydrolase family protein [Bacteroidia bacterium]
MKRFSLISTILLLMVLGNYGCGTKIPPVKESIPVFQDTMKITYLALGDSYTKGESVPLSQSFPYLLKSALEKGPLIQVKGLKVVAQTGWTTRNLLTAIDNTPLDAPYSFVTLLIGVNNQYQKIPVATYHQELPALISKAIEFAGGDTSRVCMVSIPDYACTPYGQANSPQSISPQIDQYNEIGKMYAGQFHVEWVDITDISRRGVAEPGLVANDGLHPSGLQYQKWVERIHSRVTLLLKKQ